MPSVTPFEPPMLSPSKKRRHDDDPSQVQVQLTSQHESTNLLSAINNNERFIFPTSARGAASLLNMPRKMIPLPVNKRFRLVNDNDGHLHSHNSYSHAHPESPAPTPSPHHTKLGTSLRIGPSNSQSLLSPCHICHRKPTKKSDLDSFADCLGCGQRSCFVCLRACRSWLASSEEDDDSLSASFTMQDVDDITSESSPEANQKQRNGGGTGPDSSWIGRGHRELICSRCCVERGAEGDVVCLGCLAGMEGA
ncbi:hypothetical protein F5Y00DRAFT_229809 [Daldinia vernicosa]|uniref:uncharacterized protein n=1 Tax=Daldinia vernicosa TaxID=114800 RepID=UPI002008C4B0|nr:uncharacterized protein F5Y00DRAFT_229809 [Daldinia vernicosa]KAI0851477.1 hypothetical protein F5Y00DRAFT_229809 [Daldinia vernicosa]